MILKIALTTFVTLIPAISAMIIYIPPARLDTSQTTAHNLTLFKSLANTVTQPLETVVAQAKPETATNPESSTIDHLEVAREIAGFEWMYKLCSLGIPYDPEWKKMDARQLESLHRVHKTFLEMKEKLAFFGF